MTESTNHPTSPSHGDKSPWHRQCQPCCQPRCQAARPGGAGSQRDSGRGGLGNQRRAISTKSNIPVPGSKQELVPGSACPVQPALRAERARGSHAHRRAQGMGEHQLLPREERPPKSCTSGRSGSWPPLAKAARLKTSLSPLAGPPSTEFVTLESKAECS